MYRSGSNRAPLSLSAVCVAITAASVQLRPPAARCIPDLHLVAGRCAIRRRHESGNPAHQPSDRAPAWTSPSGSGHWNWIRRNNNETVHLLWYIASAGADAN